MKLLYKFLIFGLLFQNLLDFTATAENVSCDEDGTADTPNNLCYRNKVIEKYSRIESLKKEILSKLGLDEAPNITAPVLPTSMLEDLSSLQVASSTTHTAPYYAMPITTYIVQQTRHKFGILQRDSEHTIYAYSYLVFNFTIAFKHQSVYKSNLRVQIGKELTVYPELPTDVYTLLLYVEEGKEEGEVLVSKKIIGTPANTYTLEITKLIQRLVKNAPKSSNGDVDLKFKIRVAVLKNGKKITRLVDEGKERARIIVQSYDERDVEARRSRRAVTSRYCSGTDEKRCCVRPLEINFREDLGWSYISSPATFNANYCAGDCPLNWHTENNLFYDILHKYATKNNRHIGPCCVPNEYESLNIIYHNNANEPIFAKLPNVIVRSCSCR